MDERTFKDCVLSVGNCMVHISLVSVDTWITSIEGIPPSPLPIFVRGETPPLGTGRSATGGPRAGHRCLLRLVGKKGSTRLIALMYMCTIYSNVV